MRCKGAGLRPSSVSASGHDGICSGCGRSYALTARGVVRLHHGKILGPGKPHLAYPDQVERARSLIDTNSDDPVTAYAQAIVTGQILAGRWVKLACQRHLDDLNRDDLEWRLDKALEVIEFFRDVLKLSTGRWEGRPFVLLDFQEFIQGSVFGWYYKDGRRRFDVVYMESPKGTGKSPQSAGTALYMALGDGVPRAQCLFAAATKDQARVSFNDCVAMRDQVPALAERLLKAGDKDVWKLIDTETGSFIQPIASGSALSGPIIHFAGVDELHEHPDDVVLSMLRQGMKGDNPLLFITTNSGSDRTSVCYQQRLQAQNMLEGKIPNDRLFAYICSLDNEELALMGLLPKTDREAAGIAERRETVEPIRYLLDHEELWIKANPSIGRVTSYDYVRKRLEEALGLPAQRNRVLRLNFSVWTDALTVWIPDEMWMGCSDAKLARKVTHEQFGIMSQLEYDLIGRRCYAGADLAKVDDMSSLFLVFPDDDSGLDPDNQVYSLLEWYWTDEASLREREKTEGIFGVWEREGHILYSQGSVVFDPAFIREYILNRIAPRYQILGIAYDRTFAHQLVTSLQQDGFTMVDWAQSFFGLDSPTTEVERRCKAGLFRHRGHPVTRWQMSNVRIEMNSGGMVKIDKKVREEKVDGPAALVNAMGWCMRANKGEEKSVYESRGPLVFEDVYL